VAIGTSKHAITQTIVCVIPIFMVNINKTKAATCGANSPSLSCRAGLQLYFLYAIEFIVGGDLHLVQRLALQAALRTVGYSPGQVRKLSV